MPVILEFPFLRDLPGVPDTSYTARDCLCSIPVRTTQITCKIHRRPWPSAELIANGDEDLLPMPPLPNIRHSTAPPPPSSIRQALQGPHAQFWLQ